MRPLWRLALFWLLAVAVPIQAASAATMLSCGGVPRDIAVAHAHAHSHGGVMSLTDDHPHDDSGVDSVHHLGDDHGHGGTAGGAGHKCSACASCCLSVALLSSPRFFEPIPLIDSFAPLIPHSLAVHVADGLERPPRLIRA